MSTAADRDERLRHWMMAALDGELGDAERQQLEAKLASDPELAAEWQRLNNLKELTAMSTISSPPKEVWGSYWHSVYNRMERGVGWILVSLGTLVLVSYGLWEAIHELLADSEVPGFVKLAMLALGTGVATLLLSVIREKIFVRRHDPYKEVER